VTHSVATETMKMENYIDQYPDALIKDLLWCRRYHLMLIKEIETKLLHLSKKYELTIALDHQTG
jgi:hypothetical protein